MQLNQLYQELIIDHGTSPRNHYELTQPSHSAAGFNPFCGDKLTIYLQVDEQDVIQQISFTGQGCAISMASASILTELLSKQSINDANKIISESLKLFTSDEATNVPAKLEALGGVKVFPGRVKCATLAWHTVIAAIEKNSTGYQVSSNDSQL